MKRILLSFCVLFSVVWFMPLFVHAYSQTDFNLRVLEETGVTLGTYSDDVYNFLVNNSEYPFTIEKYPSFVKFCIGTRFIQSSPDYMYEYPSPYYVYQIYYSDNVGNRKASTTMYQVYYGNINDSDFVSKWDNIDSFLVTVDYDDLIFDPSIPIPKYTSIYGILPLWNLGGSVTPQFPIQTIFTSMPEYKIEVQVRYYSPSKITFNGSRRSAFSEDWNINYNYDSLMPSEWYPLVTMQNDIQNNELILADSDYYYSWNNFITGYDSELIEFVLDPVFISASANTSIKAYAETEYAKMRNIGGCYGNQFEIMARNYYVNNGNVFVGNWFHWNSLTPENGTAEYSNDARQDNVVNGVQNTVNTTDLPTGNSLTTIGEPTGNAYNPSNNIIINQNVPNYPDYPTVADYNRDNLLIGMIKTAKAMPQYFGEFNEFLTNAFSFIDSSVWAVIALGFSASIVIMIIKIL